MSDLDHRIGNDARAMMMFEANRKSAGIAYLLWFFLGGFGGHRFYAGRIGSAVVILSLTLIGIVTSIIGIGLIPLAIVGVWVLIDAFLIPGWISRHNNLLAVQLGAR